MIEYRFKLKNKNFLIKLRKNYAKDFFGKRDKEKLKIFQCLPSTASKLGGNLFGQFGP